MMKRTRNSKAVRTGSRRKNEANEEIARFGTSLMDIPEPIFKNIVLRLPVKAIIMCKCVCKPWHRLISDPQFAKTHFALAQPCPLVRMLGNVRVARMLYLIEPSEFNVKYGSDLYYDSDPYDFILGRKYKLKLDTRLKIPLRNAEMLSQPHNASDAKSCRSRRGGFKNRCLKVKPKEHKFQIVNSCNGFLCLSEPSSNNPLVVCNPVTGEYLNLPRTDGLDKTTKEPMSCGFGFCEETKQFKVVRMIEQGLFESQFSCPITGGHTFIKRVTEVHTLGTGSWRRTGHAPSFVGKLNFTTYLNGSLHWISLRHLRLDLIYCFNLGKEQFKSIQPPPLDDDFGHPIFEWDNLRNTSLGVLRGCLCLCTGSVYDSLDVWVMQKYGEPKTWTKFVSTGSLGAERWPYCVYHPISFQKNKGLLMFLSPKSAFIYYQPETSEWKYFRILEIKTKYEAIAYIPSLISLKDVTNEDGMEILNINSRCGEYKLLGETKAISLEEVIRDLEIDTDHSLYSEEDEEM